MDNLLEIIRRHGTARSLAPGEVLLRQGMASDGLYLLQQGRLGAYREEGEALFFLSEIQPGEIVGEVGAITGWSRTATVKAEEPSVVIFLSEVDFRRLLGEFPQVAADVICQIGERLTAADMTRVNLGRSYTEALDRTQLLCSEKERLEELLRLREELAEMIVHDLRNPLAVIAGGLQLLVGPVDRQSIADVVAMIQRSVQRAQSLVEMLADIARLESGGVQLQRVPLELSELVVEAVQQENVLAQAGSVTLENRLAAGLPAVRADRDWLLRVLVNLLDNALKFTPAGGQVWVEAEEDAEQVRVAIVDTGPGIPPEERERIFEKFTQIKGRVGSRKGSGLGLAFCRQAIQAHGGRIWVEEGPGGVGSRFVFTLDKA